jgi:16S rRNA (uracil1498-N3)-methyltransferase
MRSLRLGLGDSFVLVAPDGLASRYEILEAPQRQYARLTVRLCDSWQLRRGSNLTLVQGISAAERMDQTIRQVTELGAGRIIPLQSRRCTVRLDDGAARRKLERWQRIASAAAGQSARGSLPAIELPCALDAAIAMTAAADVALLAWEECERPGFAAALRARLAGLPSKRDASVAVFIGPEGGFEPDEAEAMQRAGAIAVSLGPAILRTETAAVVACALALSEMGCLGDGMLCENSINRHPEIAEGEAQDLKTAGQEIAGQARNDGLRVFTQPDGT